VNYNDRLILKFLLGCSSEDLKKWYDTVSDEVLLYAVELLERYADYLEFEITSSKIEKQLTTMSVLLEAQAVIAAVRD